MKRVAKGNFGYTQSHRKWQILKTSLYVALALAIFIVGFVTTKTTKNVFSIFAIVSLTCFFFEPEKIPSEANSAFLSLIAFFCFRFHTPA